MWQGMSSKWAFTEVLHQDVGEWEEEGTSLGEGLGQVADFCSVKLSEDELLVSGGLVSDGRGGTKLSDQTKIYNFATQRWRHLDSLPQGRAGHGCGVIQVGGGGDGGDEWVTEI